MKAWLVLAGLWLAGAAAAQPAQPIPTASAPVSDLLESSPSITVDNGQIVAHIAPPGPNAFYRGTRFDQASVVTSLTLQGREFYGPWFDRTAPKVLDYTYDANGAVVAGPDSATSGPVEEFAPLDFAPRPGLFVKIGVGVLRQPDNQPYDHDMAPADFDAIQVIFRDDGQTHHPVSPIAEMKKPARAGRKEKRVDRTSSPCEKLYAVFKRGQPPRRHPREKFPRYKIA